MNSAFAATAWVNGELVYDKEYHAFFLGLGDSINSAKKLAFASCDEGKGYEYKCNLEISCKGKGWYASVLAWNSDKKTVTGVSCGSNSRDDALKLATKHCKKEGGIGCNTTTVINIRGDKFYSARRSGYDPNKPLTPTDKPLYNADLCGVNDNFKKADFFVGNNCHVKEYELKYNSSLDRRL